MSNESARRSPDGAWLAITGLLLLSALPVIGGVLRLGDIPSAGAVRPVASSIAAVAHIVGMTLFCLLGAFQFSPALRSRRRWHRAAGRVLIPVGFVAALGAAWLAVFFGGPPDQLPLAMVRLVFAAAMTVSLALGTAAIVRRDFAAHGDWMTRAFAIGVGNGTQALAVLLWTVPLGDVDADGETWLVATGTLLTALVAEAVIHRRAVRRGRATAAGEALVS
ncbi:MAG: DUF2306 domain-containing protein [Microbacterium sp.]|jgi:uncharacterized membrane protein YozB (DUF420 family)|uniref:DUF2306 domain-containing protein n=1 Tax=Microbacterium sp. TaxID=51671 RepID=UPI0025EDA2D6|nr:DUF2306 domain-containing protein [Microbacterium sp.]MBQ9918258.1 DUF2306 domain-containing protein [Microbacterium sp.]